MESLCPPRTGGDGPHRDAIPLDIAALIPRIRRASHARTRGLSVAARWAIIKQSLTSDVLTPALSRSEPRLGYDETSKTRPLSLPNAVSASREPDHRGDRHDMAYRRFQRNSAIMRVRGELRPGWQSSGWAGWTGRDGEWGVVSSGGRRNEREECGRQSFFARSDRLL